MQPTPDTIEATTLFLKINISCKLLFAVLFIDSSYYVYLLRFDSFYDHHHRRKQQLKLKTKKRECEMSR